MKKSTILITLFFIALPLLIQAQSKKELKEQKKKEAYITTKKLIENGIYTFEATSANTQKGRRIDLTTSYNSLKIDGKHTISDLPFFGVSQVSGYNRDGGIKFDTTDTKYTIDYNDKKQKITIKFTGINKTEVFDAFLTVFSDASATLNISSNQRDFMSFQGDVKKPEKEK